MGNINVYEKGKERLRRDAKIDNVAALLDAYVAYKHNKDAFE